MPKLKTFSRYDFICVMVILVCCLVVWWPTKTLPYHWDSAGYVVNSAYSILLDNFDHVIGRNLFYAHPPLLTLTLAVVWRLLGMGQLQSHLVILPFLPIFLMATYALARRFGPPRLALSAALLVGAMPPVLAEYGMVYVDLPMAALLTAGVALWTSRRWGWGSLALLAAILMKLPGVLGFGIYGAFLLLSYRKLARAERVRAGAWLLLPLAGLGIWLGYHYQVTGWLIIKPSIEQAYTQVSLTRVFDAAQNVVRTILWAQGRWIFSLGFLWGVATLPVKVRVRLLTNPVWLTLAALLVGTVVFFGFMHEFAIRYVLYTLPSLVILSLSVLFAALPRPGFVGLTLVMAGLLVRLWYPARVPARDWDIRPRSDLSYRDLIKTGQEAADYLAHTFPDAQIYGYFPEIYQVVEPHQGYVRSALAFAECHTFSLLPDRQQIVYIHWYSPGQRACHQILATWPHTLLKHFEVNGTWEELYLIQGQ